VYGNPIASSLYSLLLGLILLFSVSTVHCELNNILGWRGEGRDEGYRGGYPGILKTGCPQ